MFGSGAFGNYCRSIALEVEQEQEELKQLFQTSSIHPTGRHSFNESIFVLTPIEAWRLICGPGNKQAGDCPGLKARLVKQAFETSYDDVLLKDEININCNEFRIHQCGGHVDECDLGKAVNPKKGWI